MRRVEMMRWRRVETGGDDAKGGGADSFGAACRMSREVLRAREVVSRAYGDAEIQCADRSARK